MIDDPAKVYGSAASVISAEWAELIQDRFEIRFGGKDGVNPGK
jgi:hypothetical protein